MPIYGPFPVRYLDERPMLALTDAGPDASGLALKEEIGRLMPLALAGKLDAGGQQRLIGLLDEQERRRSAGPRRDGAKERLLAQIDRVHSVEDYRRVKAEVGGGVS